MTKQNLTFDQLPTAVTMLTKEVSELKSLLIQKQEQAPTERTENPLNVQGAAEFLGLTEPTIYSKCSRNELPYIKRGKRLYFFRTDLMQYLKDGRVKSNAELDQEVESFLTEKK